MRCTRIGIRMTMAACCAFAAWLALSCASAQAAAPPTYLCQIAGTASSAQCGGTGSKTPAGSVGIPGALAVNGSGDVYVGDRENDVVDEFNSTGTYLTQFNGSATPAGSFRPGAVAVNGSGDVYVADTTNEVVDEFSSTGTYLTQFNGSATPAGFFSPQALAVNGSGDVYVGDTENAVVDEFSPTGTYLAHFSGSETPAGSVGIPGALAVNGSGDVYVGDRENDVVDEFSSTGTYLTQFNGSATPAGSFSPGAVAVNGSGDIYVADSANEVVDEFSSTGTYLTQFNGSATPATFFSPHALAVNSSGDVYVGDTENAVVDEYAPEAVTEHLLTVEKEGTGAAEGKVTSTPTGIECGTTCSAEFEEGKTVTLEEQAEGATFEGWTGCSKETAGKCEVEMTAAKTVKAKFKASVLPEFPVKVKVTGEGEVNGTVISKCTTSSGTCEEKAKETKKVKLTETPKSGWKFEGWSGVSSCEGSTSSTCEFTMPSAEVDVQAKFGVITTSSLTVYITGKGKVAATGLTCSSAEECTGQFAGSVTVTATPESGYVFAGWIGCKRTSATTCEVDVTAPSEVTAVFLQEGTKGKEGPQGNEGKEGPQGREGKEGFEGIDGAIGAQGPAGEPGPFGPPGANGEKGANGATGAQGPAGPAGAQGPAGPAGKVELVTCKKAGKKRKCTTKLVSGTVTFTTAGTAAHATLSRRGVVYAAGTARHSTRGQMSLRLVPVRRLLQGHYTLTLISGSGKHETIRSESFTLS
jgi:Divergent InlB B-repeat domain/Collagen triple helix repeat (20 copies)/NHL repeat